MQNSLKFVNDGISIFEQDFAYDAAFPIPAVGDEVGLPDHLRFRVTSRRFSYGKALGIPHVQVVIELTPLRAQENPE